MSDFGNYGGGSMVRSKDFRDIDRSTLLGAGQKNELVINRHDLART